VEAQGFSPANKAKKRGALALAMPGLAPQSARTFFITTNTWARRSLFQTDRMASLLVDVLADNRNRGRFQLHEFVIMPDHVHAILTPAFEIPLERAVQFIKGGFSFRAKKELGFMGEIWQASFTEHRIKNANDYAAHRNYIYENPARRGLRGDHPYCSARGTFELDLVPPGLKPITLRAAVSQG
jgi:REP-associated tyrosine transposase